MMFLLTLTLTLTLSCCCCASDRDSDRARANCTCSSSNPTLALKSSPGIVRSSAPSPPISRTEGTRAKNSSICKHHSYGKRLSSSSKTHLRGLFRRFELFLGLLGYRFWLALLSPHFHQVAWIRFPGESGSLEGSICCFRCWGDPISTVICKECFVELFAACSKFCTCIDSKGSGSASIKKIVTSPAS